MAGASVSPTVRRAGPLECVAMFFWLEILGLGAPQGLFQKGEN